MAESSTPNHTSLYTLGARRFGSQRWTTMTLHLSAELQKVGCEPTLELLTNLTWTACLEAWGAETAHTVDTHCTRKVVGALLWSGENLLLQERLTGAVGMAPPAGHQEEVEEAESACRREVYEESGLDLVGYQVLAQGRRFERCKRYGSDYHDWTIWQRSLPPGEHELRLAPHESKTIGWYPPFQVLELAARTEDYLSLRISEADWTMRPGLEIVWYFWLKELGILERLRTQACS